MTTLPIACGIDGTIQPWDPQYAELSKDGLSLTLQPVVTGGVRAELIRNGDFATDTVWTKQSGWTISGGTANIALTGGTRNLLQTVSPLVENGQYEVVFTVSGYTSGSVTAAILGGTVVSGTARSANGTFTQTLTAGPTPSVFRLQAAINTVLSIDNVSVKRVA